MRAKMGQMVLAAALLGTMGDGKQGDAHRHRSGPTHAPAVEHHTSDLQSRIRRLEQHVASFQESAHRSRSQE